jgi:hypothetical protein
MAGQARSLLLSSTGGRKPLSSRPPAFWSRIVIRVFPRKTKWTPTDELAFVGEPPLFRPNDRQIPVAVSATFTWDIAEANRLQRSWRRFYNRVDIGGPAFDDPGGAFFPGRFVKQGVTITSRGCPKRCPWCFAWQREGQVRTLPIVPGYIVQDNNLLACPRRHVEAVFDMLSGQRAAVFSGGIDASLFTDWHRELLETIRYDELWFACDTFTRLPVLERARRICDGISQEHLRCYVLIGFGDESIDAARGRLERVYELGFLPFAQLFRGEKVVAYSEAWRKLARKWSRPAAYRKKKV